MRIAEVVTKLDVGGAQETVVRTSIGLQSKGHEVLVFAGRDAGTGGSMWEDLDAAAVDARALRWLVRPIAPLRDIAAVLELWRELRRLRPDVVHTHSSKAGVVGRVAAWLARVPVRVHTVHGWSFRDHDSALQRRAFITIERLLARITTSLVVVSEADRRSGLALHIGSAGQYAVIRSGVPAAPEVTDGERQRLAAELGVTGWQVVGSVTRFGPPKDPLTTVRAFAEVAAERDDVVLVLVGDGPVRSIVSAEIDQLGLAGRVVLTGVRRDVLPLLSMFDVFVLTSHSEGLPRAVLEALAAGLPVVASRVGGIPEVVVDGDNGCLVEDEDVAGTADGIRCALQARESSPHRVAMLPEEFTEAAMVARTVDLYAHDLGVRAS